MIPPIAAHQILLFLIQFALLLASARLLGELVERWHQPSVLGELLAGLVLGPSLLGWVSPGLFVLLFPPDPQQYHFLELISWLNRQGGGSNENISQPESRAVVAILQRFHPHVVLDVHESALLKKSTLGAQDFLTNFEAQSTWACQGRLCVRDCLKR